MMLMLETLLRSWRSCNKRGRYRRGTSLEMPGALTVRWVLEIRMKMLFRVVMYCKMYLCLNEKCMWSGGEWIVSFLEMIFVSERVVLVVVAQKRISPGRVCFFPAQYMTPSIHRCLEEDSCGLLRRQCQRFWTRFQLCGEEQRGRLWQGVLRCLCYHSFRAACK